MAGQIINAIPPRLFDFSPLANGATQDIIVSNAIDVSEWPDASLLVRVNDVSRLLGGDIVITVYYVSPTDDDPGIQFLSTDYSGAQILLYSGTPSPSLLTAPVYSPLGTALQIVITGMRNTASVDVAAVFSIDVKVTNFFAI